MSAPWSQRRLHFVGVGGAGMSAYARAAHALGAGVSGSDRAPSPYAQALAADGVLEAVIGHDAGAIPAGEDVEVVFSAAIPEANPERAAAAARGLRTLSRAQLLGELSALRRTIAVAGTHGKTTTAAMIATVLRACGVDAGYLIGGILRGSERNGEWTDGEWLVVEADESDRSLLSLRVEIAVLTSIELDHPDEYGSLRELEQVYREFLRAAERAVVWERPELLALREGPLVAYEARGFAPQRDGVRFRFGDLDVSLPLRGEHNARNAAAALAVAEQVGVDAAAAAAALAGFRGVARRFERLGATAAGAEVYDDYAHNPGKIAATLAAARTLAPRRLIAVFQPHLYSRTAALAPQLGAALAAADVIVVLEVYAARERPERHPGVSGLRVARAAADHAGGRPVHWLPDRGAAVALVRAIAAAGDIVVLIGAGDVDELGPELLAAGAAA